MLNRDHKKLPAANPSEGLDLTQEVLASPTPPKPRQSAKAVQKVIQEVETAFLVPLMELERRLPLKKAPRATLTQHYFEVSDLPALEKAIELHTSIDLSVNPLPKPLSQVRLRKTRQGGTTEYSITFKGRRTAHSRPELEFELTGAEYKSLRKLAQAGCVVKRRVALQAVIDLKTGGKVPVQIDIDVVAKAGMPLKSAPKKFQDLARVELEFQSEADLKLFMKTKNSLDFIRKQGRQLVPGSAAGEPFSMTSLARRGFDRRFAAALKRALKDLA